MQNELWRGGQRTFQVHGSTHMEDIGRAGFQVTVERYYGGDAHAYMAALRTRQGHGAQVSPELGCRVTRPAAA